MALKAPTSCPGPNLRTQPSLELPSYTSAYLLRNKQLAKIQIWHQRINLTFIESKALKEKIYLSGAAVLSCF